MNTLEIKNLHVSIDDKEILKGVNLNIKQGETHILMGPNGSGKSTLSFVLLGHPNYKITQGEILFNGENINALTPDKKAKIGLFMSFQHPSAIPGVTLTNFLRTSYNNIKKGTNQEEKTKLEEVMAFKRLLEEKMELLDFDKSFAKRNVNDGLSGGERKKSEMLQLAVLEPKIAILDELDTGLDVTALKTVAEAVNKIKGPEIGLLIITHYQRLLDHIKPDFVHVLVNGKIVADGSMELVKEIEDKGYSQWVIEAN